MAEKLSAEEAAGRLEPRDTLGIPLGPGQPGGLLEALGRRDDWEDLRVYGALLLVGTELFNHPNVHYLSGFFGPIERALRDAGANISFAPADFRRFAPLLEEQSPRVMATAAAPPDADGWCSLSLHAGGTATEMRRAADDPDRLLIVEVSERFPRTCGLLPRPPPRPPPRPDRRPGRERRGAVPDRGPAARRGRPGDRRARQRLRRRRRHAADRHRRGPVDDRRPPRRGRRRRLRRPLGDVHHRADAAARGRQGHQPQGPVRRRLGRHLRRRHRGALRVARRQPRGRLPAGRDRQLARGDRPQPGDGHDQRRDLDRHPGPGGRRHDQRRRSTRGSAATRTSSPGRRSRSRRRLAALPALDDRPSTESRSRGSSRGSTPAR